MSVEEKKARLASFIRENPAFSNVPFLMVAGKPVTPVEALALLQAGRNVEEIISGLAKLGLDLPWQLAEEFYRRLSAAYPEAPKIYALQQYVPAMTPREAYEHIKAKDSVGETLVHTYSRMLDFIRFRVNM
jgi:hypothetical protein